MGRVRISTSTATRQRTPGLWRGANERFANDPNIGTLYANDFAEDFPNPGDAARAVGPNWFVQDAAAGGTAESFAPLLGAEGADGVARLSATTGTDWFGIEAHSGASATTGDGIVLPTNSSDTKGTVVFEARVYLDDSVNDTLFVGLTEPIVEFLSATGTLPDDSDYIGFYRVDDGDLQFVVRNDNAGGTAVEYNVDIIAAADIPDGAWAKLGFRVNADNSVEIFVDEVKKTLTSDTSATIAVTSTSLPEEYLTRKIAVLRGATGDASAVRVDCDWIDCFVAE